MSVRSILKRVYCSSLWGLGYARSWLSHMERERLVSVLALHHVHPEPDAYTGAMHPDILADLLNFATSRMPVVTVAELQSESVKGPALAVTFDDGYHDFLEYAMPVLARHRVRVVQNVVVSCVQTGEPIWNQRLYDFLQAAPDSLLREIHVPELGEIDYTNRPAAAFTLSALLKRMSSARREPLLQVFSGYMARLGDYPRTRVLNRQELLQIAGQHEIGCHSYGHASMRFETDEFFHADLAQSKEYFSNVLGLPLRTYAFPNGSYRSAQIEILRRSGVGSILLTGGELATAEQRRRGVIPRINLAGSSPAEIKLRAAGCFSAKPSGRPRGEIRVLHVIPTITEAGGAERELAYLLPELRKFGIASEVAVVRPPYELEAELVAKGCPVHRFDLPERAAFRCISAIAGLIRKNRYDIVHAHLTPVNIYVAATRFITPGPKRVSSFHNVAYDSYPADTPKRRLFKLIDAVLARHGMDACVAVSNASADHYRQHLGVERPAVIQNFIPLNPSQVVAMSKDEAAARFGIDPEAPLIVMLSRFIPLKRHVDLVRAVHLLGERQVRPSLLMIGTGAESDRVKQLTKELGLEPQVRVIDSVAHDLAMSVLAGCDIAVLPSTHEGFGIAAAEAMLLGRAVVVADAAGLSELVVHGRTGLKVPPTDPEALAAAIELLIHNPELRERLGRAAMVEMEQMVGMSAILPRWVALYRNLLSRDVPAHAAALVAE